MSTLSPTPTESPAGWGWGYAETSSQNNAVSAVASGTSRVEGYEWVVIPSIVLLVRPLSCLPFVSTAGAGVGVAKNFYLV